MLSQVLKLWGPPTLLGIYLHRKAWRQEHMCIRKPQILKLPKCHKEVLKFTLVSPEPPPNPACASDLGGTDPSFLLVTHPNAQLGSPWLPLQSLQPSFPYLPGHSPRPKTSERLPTLAYWQTSQYQEQENILRLYCNSTALTTHSHHFQLYVKSGLSLKAISRDLPDGSLVGYCLPMQGMWIRFQIGS